MRWLSSTESGRWKEKDVKVETNQKKQSSLTITSTARQLVEGFGGCFNELGYEALSFLSEEDREQVLYHLFHPDGDCKFSVCRLPIGASDYALEWYSLNEHDDDYEMEHFSIERDRKYLIPYIKEALRFNPNLTLFASPWSPPTWMKTPKAYNYGTLRWEKEVLEAYALYFVKFIEAYKQEGITIHQIHVQNEVVADQKFPSCVWTGEQLREFIRDYLGPAFKRHHIETEIWLGTINAPEPWDEWMKGKAQDHDEYAHTVLSDPEAYKYVSGVGYQWAGKYGIQRTVLSYPELRYMQTENECGDGTNTWFYAKYIFNLYQHYFTNGVNSYIYWNMVLQPKGRSTWGWEQNSMLTIEKEQQQLTQNPEYYVMKHFSHFVRPDARRIETTGSWTGNSLVFENKDGSLVVVIQNPFKEEREVVIEHNGQQYSFSLEAESFNSIVL
ncbi:glycoside hydrolase family 30 beta sandwich domain-containing protein [Halalkalibacter sp. APA_J-10(15)]|uniref:glycoside hydrolase family 30 protein n=1 Tax=unclassified Halalkalibacter TaxID=2893063 RepID=UPI001FF5B2B0|nr:glycoside hydrolase family 30 protein [Halalkalibacter sp. APA_J-10(15)]MCK0471813.1 glycosyl hydrolase [Halalkalibacter sp. APA_J-10(15)]